MTSDELNAVYQAMVERTQPDGGISPMILIFMITDPQDTGAPTANGISQLKSLKAQGNPLAAAMLKDYAESTAFPDWKNAKAWVLSVQPEMAKTLKEGVSTDMFVPTELKSKEGIRNMASWGDKQATEIFKTRADANDAEDQKVLEKIDYKDAGLQWVDTSIPPDDQGGEDPLDLDLSLPKSTKIAIGVGAAALILLALIAAFRKR